MNKLDGRSLSEESLEVLRRQAHRLRQQQHTWSEIASIVGMHLSTVMGWSRRFDIGSASGKALRLASAPRGRRFGQARTLDLADEVWLREIMSSRRPRDWDCRMRCRAAGRCKRRSRRSLPLDMLIRTVGEYLGRWGFTPQRPAKHALEQRPEHMRQWREVDYPPIVKRAKAEGALVHWADEKAVRQDKAWVRGYAPVGHTPRLEHAAKRPRPAIAMISALSNHGLVRFGFHGGAINAERFIGFMADPVHDTSVKACLVADMLPAHRAGKVSRWVAEHKEDMKLFYLPPYSPQMNSDEWLNRDLKTELRTRPAATDHDTLKAIAQRFMHTLASTPQHIMNYFSNQHIAYAGVNAMYCV